MAPLIPDIISPEFNYMIALIMGIGFGFALEQAGFSSTRKLVGLFYGYDFTVLRVFFTAGITAMIGVVILAHLGLLNSDIIFVNPTFLYSALVGGVIMGAGFIIGGFCPGTSVCAAAVGKVDGWAFVLGAIIGIFIFGEVFPLFENLYMAKSMGPLLMYDALGMEKLPFALMMTAIALFAFVATGMIEDKVNKRPVSLLSGNWKRQMLAAALPIVLLVLVMASPTRNEYIMSKLKAKAASGECTPSLIEADKLVFELINNYYQYNVIDVRSPEEYQAFHIATAINIPLVELSRPEFRQLLNQRLKTNVFYGNSSDQGKEACLIARYHGNKTSLALKETATVFQQQFYGQQATGNNLSKHDVTVAHFRSEAVIKMKEIEENIAAMDKPVKKKVTRVQGGC